MYARNYAVRNGEIAWTSRVGNDRLKVLGLGAMGMSVWSNISECATYMVRRQDPEFHGRALEWEGGFIVGGHNYGQGSSHRPNLISQGNLPLVLADEAELHKAQQGDEWEI